MSEIIDSYEQDLIDNLKSAQNKISSSFDTKEDWKDLRALLT
jgi:hypothetical protein